MIGVAKINVIRACRPEPGDRFDLHRPHGGGDLIEQMAAPHRRDDRKNPRPLASNLTSTVYDVDRGTR